MNDTPNRRTRRPDQVAQPEISDEQAQVDGIESNPGPDNLTDGAIDAVLEAHQQREDAGLEGPPAGSDIEITEGLIDEDQPDQPESTQAPAERGPEKPVIVLPFIADGVVIRDSENRVLAVCGNAHQDMGTRELLCQQLVENLNRG